MNLANGNKNKIAYIRDDILEIIYSMFLVFEITYFISKLAQLFENSKKGSRGGGCGIHKLSINNPMPTFCLSSPFVANSCPCQGVEVSTPGVKLLKF